MMLNAKGYLLRDCIKIPVALVICLNILSMQHQWISAKQSHFLKKGSEQQAWILTITDDG